MNTALNIRDVGPEIKEALAERAKAEGRPMGEIAKSILADALCVERPRRELGRMAHLLKRPMRRDDGVGSDPEVLAAIDAPDPLVGDPGTHT